MLLIGSVILASLFGSLHCAGMCGAFVSLACGFERSTRKSATLQAGYHAGRLAGYTALGLVAGALGSVVDLGSSAIGAGRIAAGLAAVTMLCMALVLLAQAAGIAIPLPRWSPMSKAFKRSVGLAQRVPPRSRAALIGACSVLLPCGWLYAFAVLGAATASPLQGALIMAAFWVGTVPALSLVGFGVQSLRARLGGALQPLSAVLMLVFGAMTLVSAVGVSDSALAGMLNAEPSVLESPEDADCPLCREDEP